MVYNPISDNYKNQCSTRLANRKNVYKSRVQHYLTEMISKYYILRHRKSHWH